MHYFLNLERSFLLAINNASFSALAFNSRCGEWKAKYHIQYKDCNVQGILGAIQKNKKILKACI